ncbi:hypothetical protein ElyMa_004857400 [Elysia marginata]|uniref:Uncharacterized protein n=1 Tax=Elysia marginata TaxID=1093978 RepID=A0AAV4ISV8_9GAST|nr:hypothetical protein ElyMa_004857400 [Elysia marginata]
MVLSNAEPGARANVDLQPAFNRVIPSFMMQIRALIVSRQEGPGRGDPGLSFQELFQHLGQLADDMPGDLASEFNLQYLLLPERRRKEEEEEKKQKKRENIKKRKKKKKNLKLKKKRKKKK